VTPIKKSPSPQTATGRQPLPLSASAAPTDMPGPPPTPPRERRYGVDGFEFYQHGFFTPIGDVWQPEDPAERLSTVRWT